MQRLLRLSSCLLLLCLFAYEGMAQQPVLLRGRVAPGEVRVLLRDSLYVVNGTYMIGGTLIIEPGTTVEFTDNSRLVDSVGGRIIADGQMQATFNYPIAPGNPGAVDFNTFDVDPSTPGTQLAYGYADPAFFLAPGVVSVNTTQEATVSAAKNNFVYNVRLDTTLAPGNIGGTLNSRNRLLLNYTPTGNGGASFQGTDLPANNFVVRPEQAIIYEAARLRFANADPFINTLPYRRVGNRPINITPARITFRGRRVNNFSREWGHIVVLPGARAAFFRDVDFQNFRKDTTVDGYDYAANRGRYYDAVAGETPAQATARLQANLNIGNLSNGGGGVITTFSSRLWLLACNFSNNFARFRGGAVQFLEAPANAGFYPQTDITTLPTYPNGFNSGLRNNVDGLVSSINTAVRATDNIDDIVTGLPAGQEVLSDAARQNVDDGRLAVALGRVRNLTFTNNTVSLANVVSRVIGGFVVVTDDETSNTYNEARKNQAFGGALYLAGTRRLEVGFGVNDTINGQFVGVKDFVSFTGNTARNLQRAVGTSGARGGAVYVGNATAAIFGGRFANNSTTVPNLATNPENQLNIGNFSLGGAICADSGSIRLQIRGGQDLNTSYPSHFLSNSAGRGGAIYVATNASESLLSPVLGGSDAFIFTRNFGYDIRFDRNQASFDGGAIYTGRNMTAFGAGGVEANSLLGYALPFRMSFTRNLAGYSGGALSINLAQGLDFSRRYVQIARVIMDSNAVGTNLLNSSDTSLNVIRGGGAVYALNANLNVVKGAEFVSNRVVGGNGGAIALVSPGIESKRFFTTDVDLLNPAVGAEVNTFTSVDAPFVNPQIAPFQPDARMLTRFIDNEAVPNMSRMGNGLTQLPNPVLTHPGTNLPENGTGLGGAIYILDNQNDSRIGRSDTIFFNRARIQNNRAFTGAAVYSDNYDLKIAFARSLITNNVATSDSGRAQNVITGPRVNDGTNNINAASSDLAGAVLYGEIVGPIPFESFSVAANSIFDNSARFLIRLPDAPNTKGLLAGGNIGSGGVDTLRGNYWGRTEANVTTVLPSGTLQSTFFVAGDGRTHLRFIRGGSGLNQGPFESLNRYSYTPIVSENGADENTPAAESIPDTLLMQGKVYDLFDKGTDIKTVDYANRRMVPIEDFAVGIPARMRRFVESQFNGQPSLNKVVRRMTRDPFMVDAGDTVITALQGEFRGTHPIGYPLFLESRANYSGSADFSNQDHPAAPTVNESVFFVINVTTGDFVRVPMRQITASSETFRARVELVPDSATRNGNTALRRSEEGLANLGSGAALLNALRQNPQNEDAAALQGRRYQERTNNFGVQFSNRPGMPASNLDTVNFWAGERYRALPVNVGDEVWVVSRTILWNEGVDSANNTSVRFTIGASTPAPLFTGNTLQLQNSLPVELRNMVFVTEDRSYPGDYAAPSRDSIFTLTAIDSNNFFDPRSLLFPGTQTALTYTWDVDQGSGLSYWLGADTLRYTAGQTTPTYGALGHLVFRGRPTNPFIVPGGEVVRVSAFNYPPNARTLDSLRAAGVPDSIIARYIYLFPPYFHAESYDVENARFLQQDTINVGSQATAQYSFRVFVVDTTPRWSQATVQCGTDSVLYANLTDSLRMRVDLNTDDEQEDADAALRGWDFRYGRTSYAFESVAIRSNPGDTSVTELSPVRPTWMSNTYFRRYNNSGTPDQLAADFTQNGQINIRIDSITARNLLLPVRQFHGALNTDSIVTFVVNDGHGGLNYLTRPVRVNLAPVITTTSLPDAREDMDYNVALLDTLRMIRAQDANFGQVLSYELLYPTSSQTEIARDLCYPEAGSIDVRNRKTTPNWLRINPVSGLLYGTPRVTDVPANDTTVLVTVVVTDEGGLSDVRTIPLRILAVNHRPDLSLIPTVRCVEFTQAYVDSITVTDIDLRRDETLTFSVLAPNNQFQITPQTVSGNRDTNVVRVAISTTSFAGQRDADGKVTIRIAVVDARGAADTVLYRVNVSQPTDFNVDVRVQNIRGAFQTLNFGTGSQNATTGEEQTQIGRLDSQYCEYELPPVPPTDVFDARWAISNTNGVLRNIFPTGATTEVGKQLIYKGRFQPGNIGQVGANYPVTLSWRPSRVPAKGDFVKNPSGGSWYLRDAATNGQIFNVNMNTVVGEWLTGILVEKNGDSATVTIQRNNIQDFVILYDVTSGVEDQPTAGYATKVELYENAPNPFSASTNVRFFLPTDARVTVEIFDALGAKVATLADGLYNAGNHSIEWNGSANGVAMPNGMYVVKLSAGSTSLVRQMMIVR